MDWIKALPYTIRFPEYNALIVHAGLIQDVQLEEQKWVDMTCMRDAIEVVNGEGEGEGGGEAGTGAGKTGSAVGPRLVGTETPTATSVPWASTWQGPTHVYFGHDAIRRLQQYVICLHSPTCIHACSSTHPPTSGVVSISVHCARC